MTGTLQKSNVTIIGAGPYGLAAAAYLRAAGVEARVFGEPMEFWQNQMPVGMCLRSSWSASHIADPKQEVTLDAYCQQNGNHVSKPIPLDRFVDYGQWYQRTLVPHLERRHVSRVDLDPGGFRVTLADGEEFVSRRVLVATGIGTFARRPAEFVGIASELASHSSEQKDLRKFKGQRVVVVGAGQSALESAALFKEAGIEVEVIGRQKTLRWVGLHPKLHHLGAISWLLYSPRDVGPAGISRLVALPHVFRRFPRPFQDRTAYRAIRPAGAGWLQPRLVGVPITLGRRFLSVKAKGSQLHLRLDDGTERLIDHALLATGYRVDVSRYEFLSGPVLQRLETVNGYPVLQRGLECSVPGLHFLGKPAAWSFGPLLGFVSGTEFAAHELLHSFPHRNGTR
ncbi:MAG TPA: FAD-dependent oxidoreductase [Terriglobales bacterium]|nr:FAD-dependent oxidoreductase [Terriglobales bacterium]